MSTVVISYNGLDKAAEKARTVAMRLSSYHSQVEEGVFRKLKKYSENSMVDVSNVKTNISLKISELKKKSDQFIQYANDLQVLKDQCRSVDGAVKAKIETLTQDFKVKYQISSNQNSVGQRPDHSYGAGTHGFNSAYGAIPGGASGGDTWEAFMYDRMYQKSRLEDKFWRRFEGGQQAIDNGTGIGLRIVTSVLAVAGAVITIASGGTALVIAGAVATIVVGVLDVYNALIDKDNEQLAYQANKENDPAKALHHSNINSKQDELRNSAVKKDHTYAGILDGIQIVGGIVSIVSSVATLAKNGYKWAMNSGAHHNQIKLGDVFTKQVFKNGLSKMKGKIGDIASELKKGRLKAIIKFSKSSGKTFLTNLKDHYLGFGDVRTMKGLEATVRTSKNIASLAKDFHETRSSKSIEDRGKKIAIKHLILPGITAFKTKTNKNPDGSKIRDKILRNKEKSITLDKVFSPFIQTKKLGESLFKEEIKPHKMAKKDLEEYRLILDKLKQVDNSLRGSLYRILNDMGLLDLQRNANGDTYYITMPAE